MESNQTNRWRVLEVHNFGGFFGGDTVTVTAEDLRTHVEETITIDEKALANVDDRYKVAPMMVFELQMTGERVDCAELVAAAEWQTIKPTLTPPSSSAILPGPRIRAYHCGHCELWILGEPSVEAGSARCRLCGEPL